MATNARVRPSSAGGKLQSHASYYTGLNDVRRGATLSELPRLERRRQLQLTAQELDARVQTPSARQEEKRRTRRPTINAAEDARGLLAERKMHEVSRWLGESMRGKVEQHIDLHALDAFKKAFHASDVDGSGSLNLSEFKKLLRDKLRLAGDQDAQVEALFDKIDWSSEGAVSWDEFCTFMQVEFADKQDSYLRAKEVSFLLPAASEMTPHRSDVAAMNSSADGTFVVLGVDGLFSFWNSNCTVKKTRSIITSEQNQRSNPKWITDFVFMTEFNKIVVTTGDREVEFFEQSSFEPYCCIVGLETIPLKLTYHVPKTNVDECVIIFGDRQGCLNILLLHATGESLRTWKKFPKSEGIPTVSLDIVVNSANVEFIRWKVHNEWINELRYEPSTDQTISCSNDDDSAVVIGSIRGSTNIDASLREVHAQVYGTGTGTGAPSGRLSRATSISMSAVPASAGSARPSETPLPLPLPLVTMTSQTASSEHHPAPPTNFQSMNVAFNVPRTRAESDQLVFKIYKGAKTFVFSDAKNLLVTGGMDRIIRTWNPYVPSKPTGFLRGHRTPVVYLCVDESENRLFSMSSDKSIIVWDLTDLGCLLNVRPKAHQIRGDLQCCHFSLESRTLCVATDQMSMLNLRLNFRRQVQFRAQAYLQPRHVVAKLNDLAYLASHYAGGAIAIQLQETGVDVATGRVALHNADVPLMRAEVVLSHKEPVTACRFNPLRKHVVSCSEGSVIKVWDIESGSQVFESDKAHGEWAITCASFDLTGRRLVTGGRDGCLRLWNYINGHCLQLLCKEKKAEVTGVTYVEMNKNRYIIAVGWDKCINVYNDYVRDNIHLVNRPLPRWTDDEAHGHKEDILAIADCPPNYLATSSYDGRVIVWNLISGHVMAHLDARPPPNYQDDSIDGDLGISRLCFIRSRIQRRSEGILVASGPRAHIHIWTIFQGGKLMAQFRAAPVERQAQVTGVTVGEDAEEQATLLIAADQLGYAYVWNITEYARKEETDAPPLLASWRAHTQTVTGLEYSAAHGTIVSSSADCTVRLWTQRGHYIGTFGQPVAWNIFDSSTYQHPMVPFDVLVDPRSLPARFITEKKKDTRKASARTQNFEWQLSNFASSVQQTLVDDETIEEQIRKSEHRLGQGKRLRHEILKPTIREYGGPNDYQHLVCFELDQPKKVGEPAVLSARRKPTSLSD